MSPYLEHAEPAELLAAAAHKTKEELLLLLAERFPKPSVPTSLLPIGPPRALVASAPSPGADPATPPSLLPPAQASDADAGIRPFRPPAGRSTHMRQRM